MKSCPEINEGLPFPQLNSGLNMSVPVKGGLTRAARWHCTQFSSLQFHIFHCTFVQSYFLPWHPPDTHVLCLFHTPQLLSGLMFRLFLLPVVFPWSDVVCSKLRKISNVVCASPGFCASLFLQHGVQDYWGSVGQLMKNPSGLTSGSKNSLSLALCEIKIEERLWLLFWHKTLQCFVPGPNSFTRHSVGQGQIYCCRSWEVQMTPFFPYPSSF